MFFLNALGGLSTFGDRFVFICFVFTCFQRYEKRFLVMRFSGIRQSSHARYFRSPLFFFFD